MKTFLIKQPKGLGDIFFCQKIAIYLALKGNRVIWPVITKYNYVKDYITGDENLVEYCDLNDSFDFKQEYLTALKGNITEFTDCIVVSTDGCPETDTGGVMVNKYRLVNLPYEDWKAFFTFKRNLDKENDLYNFLGIKNEPYIFVNKNIGGPGDESAWQFNIPSDKKIVELKEIEGYNVFDWCKVLENASEFYTMETCISYLVEKIPTKATAYKMFHRSPSSSQNFKEFMSIYSKPTEHIGREKIVMLQN